MRDAMIQKAVEAEASFLANAELMSTYEIAEKNRLGVIANQRFWEKMVKNATERKW